MSLNRKNKYSPKKIKVPTKPKASPNEVNIKSECIFILKISGIWETQNSYGITYKFIKNNE